MASSIVTIPKKVSGGEELVVIPRKEYDELLEMRSKKIKEVSLTPRQKNALLQARKNLARGKYLTLNELKSKLGFTS